MVNFLWAFLQISPKLHLSTFLICMPIPFLSNLGEELYWLEWKCWNVKITW